MLFFPTLWCRCRMKPQVTEVNTQPDRSQDFTSSVLIPGLCQNCYIPHMFFFSHSTLFSQSRELLFNIVAYLSWEYDGSSACKPCFHQACDLQELYFCLASGSSSRGSDWIWQNLIYALNCWCSFWWFIISPDFSSLCSNLPCKVSSGVLKIIIYSFW